ncbi:carboxymuconolactone decarboxylase family protein [Nocardia sp. NPDC057353]|uniref:carboxymuconolactone decarboxylase family protein n=1 Tax=Nocardia sp. NPDC057353 TaxID=3346104 RepID=UPI003632AB41
MSDRIGIDEQSPSVYKSQVGVAFAAKQAAKRAGLDRLLVELVNVRVSQLNGCARCLDVHTRAAREAGETEQRLNVLAAWREAGVYSDQERAALTLAEVVTVLPPPDEQERAYAAAREHLDDHQFAAVAWIAITINAFNRISIVSGHEVHPRG